jgi:acylphosphatase
MMIRAHVFVSGRVQGVCFRHYAVKWADGLGVRGWVRNCWDGRVEAVIEGEKDKVEDMVNKMRGGPSWAAVEEMEVRWEDYRGEFSNFRIARHSD